ncbi:glycoside hydrolase family 2 TIM barrel-domain containing protein [Arcanobacterium hippocoleae]|uniref:glycoside hydrolase family 2 TIM barrel-domain containing protein n=1 Tax=Arcanobacterium hippocoleae TaxID=149017 RepID=UPI00333E8D12
MEIYLGEQSGAQNPQFDDSAWRNVDLPHDYSIERDYTQTGEAESGYLPGGIGWYRKVLPVPAELAGKRINLNFDGIYMDATIYLNGIQLATHPYGYTPFSVDATDAVKYGADNILAVRVNHQTPSSRWYSGSGIYRDVDLVITDPIHLSHDGVKVTAKNIDTYTGSGTLNLQIETAIENESAVDANVTLKHTVHAKSDGRKIGEAEAEQRLAPGAKATKSVALAVDSPKLWNLSNPSLYIVKTEVIRDGEVVDTVETTTGFRKIEFLADTGFALNGEKMKLKGVSMHHDQGALGAKAYRRAIERQIEILQEMGANAIRVTHNPASRDLIQLADEKGMLIVEEIFDGWHVAKNGNHHDYARFFNQQVPADTKLENVTAGSTWARFDVEATLRRDYNAPSVIMWSLGNEINEGAGYGDLVRVYGSAQHNLIQWAAAIDQTRPLTRGDNMLKSKSYNSVQAMENLVTEAKTAGSSGLVGTNYANGTQFDTLHREHPQWKIYGSETASAINSRGVYDSVNNESPKHRRRLTAYDQKKVNWGHFASEAWYDVITRDFVAGEFVWTGFDYIGEPTPWNGTDAGAKGGWPAPKNSYFGIIDTAGFPKDSYYLYQSQWNEKAHTLHLLPAWNSDVVVNQGQGNVPVVVYTDAHRVELYFTPTGGTRQKIGEKSFTEKTTPGGFKYQIYTGPEKQAAPHQNLYLTWQVPYQDGKLEAVGYDAQGVKLENTLGRNIVQTAGTAKKLAVHLDRPQIKADGEDLAYIDVTITDEHNVPVPNAEHIVKFATQGQCRIVGTDNGEHADHTSFLATERKAFAGKVLGILQATNIPGECQVTVSAQGLESQTVVVSTKQVGTADADGVDAYRYPRNYYVQLGEQPKLPAQIDAIMKDGQTREASVAWAEIAAAQITQAGSFIVKGRTSLGDEISVNVTMLNSIGAVLNYSAVTSVGNPHTLPAARPAVLPNGEVLATTFPVRWEEPKADQYNAPGLLEIAGTATVFGKELPVKATIRVENEQVTVGKNLASAALKVTQSVPEGKQDDTLAAINDGKTAAPAYTGGGKNPNVWTNYTISQDGETKSHIIFAYATQQRFAEFGVYFYRDSWAARYPAAGATKFYVSETESGPWTPVEATETIGTESTNVKPYTYKLAKPVTATFVKIELTNSAQDLANRKPCIGISEVLLKGAQTIAVSANETAGLESLQVNHAAVPVSALAAWKFVTPAEKVVQLKATAKDNSAVTELPAYAGIVRVIVESENQQMRKIFQILLGQDQPLAADDAARDIAPKEMKIVVGSEAAASGNNSKESALDNNPKTVWHTPWGNQNPINGNTAKFAEKGWAMLILDQPRDIAALRYLPRADGNNGTITEYDVFVSNFSPTARAAGDTAAVLPPDTEFTKVASGTWADNHQWQIAQFEQVRTVRYVKLVPKATASDTRPNLFVSAAELRLREAKPVIDLADAARGYTVNPEPSEVLVEKVDAEHLARPEKVTVADKNGNQLIEGVNYRLSYTGDAQAGTAMVKVTGINTHKGTLTAQYVIKVVPPKSQVAKQELANRLAQLTKVSTNGKTPESVAAFKAAIASAQAVLDRADATQEDVLTAVQSLVGAEAILQDQAISDATGDGTSGAPDPGDSTTDSEPGEGNGSDASNQDSSTEANSGSETGAGADPNVNSGTATAQAHRKVAAAQPKPTARSLTDRFAASASRGINLAKTGAGIFGLVVLAGVLGAAGMMVIRRREK